jgi:hypothetical protein
VKNLGHRFYSTGLGRWISRDVRRAIAINLYALLTARGEVSISVDQRRYGAPVILMRKSFSSGGEAECNPNTGNIVITIKKETCAGNCVWKHELTHRGQQQPCCQKLAAACAANPAQCTAYKIEYNAWHTANYNRFECGALIATAACYLGTLTDDLKKKDCPCYVQMQGEAKEIWIMKDQACGAVSNPLDITPCPDF